MEKSSKNQWEHLTVYTDTNYVLLLSIIYYLLVIAKTEELKNDMKFIGQMANVSFTTTIGDDVSKSLKLIRNYNFGFQSRTTTKERNLPATICHYLITRHCRNLSTFINLTLKCFSTVQWDIIRILNIVTEIYISDCICMLWYCFNICNITGKHLF